MQEYSAAAEKNAITVYTELCCCSVVTYLLI